MDGWKLHTHSDHRGQRTPGAKLLPTRGSRSSSSHPPSCRRGPAVGLNRGRPDGAHRVDNQSASVCPPKPFQCGVGGEAGDRERGPALTLLRQTAPYAAQARTGLCLDCCAHLTPTLHFSLVIGLSASRHPWHREKQLIPLLDRPCPPWGAFLRICVLILEPRLIHFSSHCHLTPLP